MGTMTRVAGPQGHVLTIHGDDSIALSPPDSAPGAGLTFACPGGMWDYIEGLVLRVQEAEALAESAGGAGAAIPLTKRQRAREAIAFLADLEEEMREAEGDTTRAIHESLAEVLDTPQPDVADFGLPMGDDGEFVLVEDPEDLDLAVAIADAVRAEENGKGEEDADLERIGRFQNRVKALRAGVRFQFGANVE